MELTSTQLLSAIGVWVGYLAILISLPFSYATLALAGIIVEVSFGAVLVYSMYKNTQNQNI